MNLRNDDMNQRLAIRPWDWLLIIGTILAPMTGLRIWKIGPAELLCFIWAIRYISIKKLKSDELVSFFVPYLVGMLFGTCICVFAAPAELRMGSWGTWIYLAFIACTVYKRIQSNTVEYNELVLDRICVFSAYWYGFLYVFSRVVSKSFLGAPLWYYTARYSGGGTNPHQVAILLCIIAFWFTRQFFKGQEPLKNIVLFVLTVFLETETKSSTGLASIFLGVFTIAVILTILQVNNKRTRVAIVFAEVCLGLIVAILFQGVIYDMVYEWVASDQNGLGRFYIWSSIKQMFVKSPIFGLGPGTHGISYDGMKEFHNSYLEIYAASGVVGSIALLAFTWKLVKKIIKGDILLLPITVSVYVYSMAGFAFRRLAFWVPIAFIAAIAKQYCESDLESGELELWDAFKDDKEEQHEFNEAELRDTSEDDRVEEQNFSEAELRDVSIDDRVEEQNFSEAELRDVSEDDSVEEQDFSEAELRDVSEDDRVEKQDLSEEDLWDASEDDREEE